MSEKYKYTTRYKKLDGGMNITNAEINGEFNYTQEIIPGPGGGGGDLSNYYDKDEINAGAGIKEIVLVDTNGYLSEEQLTLAQQNNVVIKDSNGFVYHKNTVDNTQIIYIAKNTNGGYTYDSVGRQLLYENEQCVITISTGYFQISHLSITINNESENIAEDYNTSHTYNTNDLCTYEGKLYICLNDNITGNWDSTKWQEVTVDEEFQRKLVSGTNIKTINGASVLGSGDLQVATRNDYPASWPVSSSSTTLDFCNAVNADASAVEGMTFLGEVMWSDLPSTLVNAEIVVEIMFGSGTSNKVIHLVCTSGNLAPYRWEYTYWNNGAAVSGWIGFQPELVAGQNITISGNTISATGGSGTDLIAPDYSASSTYAVGDLVIYDDKLYRCNTAIVSAEAWTAAHWSLTDMATATKPDTALNANSIQPVQNKVLYTALNNVTASTIGMQFSSSTQTGGTALKSITVTNPDTTVDKWNIEDELPAVSSSDKDKYLHTNSSTGALEWSTVSGGGGGSSDVVFLDVTWNMSATEGSGTITHSDYTNAFASQKEVIIRLVDTTADIEPMYLYLYLTNLNAVNGNAKFTGKVGNAEYQAELSGTDSSGHALTWKVTNVLKAIKFQNSVDHILAYIMQEDVFENLLVLISGIAGQTVTEQTLPTIFNYFISMSTMDTMCFYLQEIANRSDDIYVFIAQYDTSLKAVYQIQEQNHLVTVFKGSYSFSLNELSGHLGATCLAVETGCKVVRARSSTGSAWNKVLE